MNKKIYLVDLEKVPTRYTWEWHDHFPKMLKEAGFDVEVVGAEYTTPATSGAFLNFMATNEYKSIQAMKLSRLFMESKIKDGDVILFADAWNPVVLQTKYMKDLSGIDVTLGGLWHAGSYIDEDILGDRIKDKRWSYATEQAMYHALDFNYFATDWHIDHFFNKLGLKYESERVVKTGWPMTYVTDRTYEGEKEDVIIFPHRISKEKQVEVFDALETLLPQYKFVVCQREGMDKEAYHRALAGAKVMFSAATLETLGICQVEALAAKCLPLVPDRLSYSEMYPESTRHAFMYESDLTLDCDASDLSVLKDRIVYMMENYDSLVEHVRPTLNFQMERFFDCKPLIDSLK